MSNKDNKEKEILDYCKFIKKTILDVSLIAGSSSAHFGGALAGFVITLLIYPSLIYMQINLILLMLAPLLLYLVMKRIGYL